MARFTNVKHRRKARVGNTDIGFMRLQVEVMVETSDMVEKKVSNITEKKFLTSILKIFLWSFSYSLYPKNYFYFVLYS